MKFFAAIALALFFAIPAALAQQSPDDQYVIIYTLIQQGDANVDAGQPKQALGDYVEAQRELKKFQQVYSDWNPKIVSFRLNYLADRITALTPQQATNAPAPATVPPPVPADWQAQLAALNTKIQNLQGDNQTLQAKLKEALTAQPASASPEEIARMQAQIQELAKENELLKATTNAASIPAPAAQGNPQLQQMLAAETARADQYAQQNQALQARVQSLTTDANAAEALREENALLKKELASAGVAPAGSDLATARTEIIRLQSLENAQIAQATADWLEKTALENRVKQWQEASVSSAAVDGAPAQEDLQSQINELKQERDNLLAQLGEANKKLYGSKKQSTAAQIDQLAQQVETLRSRIAVDEAQAVPYTAQELALFRPEPLTANTNAEKKSVHELPGGAAVLVAQAQSYFTHRQYDQAAADYQKILQREPNNPLALANLAAIEVEQNKTADADKHIQAAIAQQPNDAFNLTVLGRVRFSEGNNDGALDALDRAAKLDPQNPQIQNFLGVALAQKGLRVQAETAFRTAIQIDPEYGDAHKNLAIIYLSSNPPAVELARWHYEKALAAGVAADTDLEKLLNESNAAKLPQ